jgi:hypothetical protein
MNDRNIAPERKLAIISIPDVRFFQPFSILASMTSGVCFLLAFCFQFIHPGILCSFFIKGSGFCVHYILSQPLMGSRIMNCQVKMHGEDV